MKFILCILLVIASLSCSKKSIGTAGHGFNIRLTRSNGNAVGNKVYSSNIVNGAAKGVSNIPLSN